MSLKFGDRVRETTTTTGSGTLTLAGAVSKYRAFGDVLSNADVTFYACVHRAAAEWEVGYGTWATGGTLARTAVLSSSNGGAAVNFSAGTKDVFITAPAIQAEKPGFVKDFAGSTAPEGYLACDGSNVSRTTYKALFDAIGTTWGVGDGSTTFALPDFRRRVAVGSGGSGTATLANSVGSTGGAETHTLTTAELPAHQHTFSATSGTESADHIHYTPLYGSDESNFDVYTRANPAYSQHFHSYAATTGRSAAHTHTTSGTTDNAGSGSSHNIMQPSAVVLKVIKY